MIAINGRAITHQEIIHNIRWLIQKGYFRDYVCVILVFRTDMFVGFISPQYYQEFSQKMQQYCEEQTADRGHFYTFDRIRCRENEAKAAIKEALSYFYHLFQIPLCGVSFFAVLDVLGERLTKITISTEQVFSLFKLNAVYMAQNFSKETFTFFFKNRQITTEEHKEWIQATKYYSGTSWNDSPDKVVGFPKTKTYCITGAEYNIVNLDICSLPQKKIRTVCLFFPEAIVSGQIPLKTFTKLHERFEKFTALEDRVFDAGSNAVYSVDYDLYQSPDDLTKFQELLKAIVSAYDPISIRKLLLTSSPEWSTIFVTEVDKNDGNGFYVNRGNMVIYNLTSCKESFFKSLFFF